MSEAKSARTPISSIPQLAVSGVPRSVRAEASAPEGSLVAECTGWLALDIEIDRLATRWARLEAEALDYDYSEPSSCAPTLLAEMERISEQLGIMGDERNHRLKAITAIQPINLHEVATQLAVAARTLLYEDVWAEPLLRMAITHLATATCPGCGRPHVPAPPT